MKLRNSFAFLLFSLLLVCSVPACTADDQPSAPDTAPASSSAPAGSATPASSSATAGSATPARSADAAPASADAAPASSSATAGSATPARSADAAPASDAAAAESTATVASPAGHRTLEGGVKGTAIPFSEGINRIGAACYLIQESTERIIKDASRKDTIVMRGPNVLPNGTVIPALGGVGGVMQMGAMPIHRDKLVRWLSQSEENLAALQSYVDALIVPPEKASEASAAYAAMKAAMVRAQTHMDVLKELAARKRPPNDRVAAEAAAIHEAMSDVLKQRATIQALVSAH